MHLNPLPAVARHTQVAMAVALMSQPPAPRPPVQAPTKFSLVVNLKAAKALGLAMLSSVLGYADDVIDRPMSAIGP